MKISEEAIAEVKAKFQTDISFSEAMREGSRQSYKIVGLRHNGLGGTCALGAAELGAGLVSVYGESGIGRIIHSLAEMYWLWIDLEEEVHPVCGEKESVNAIVASLNNGQAYGPHNFAPWTREKIADWVEGIELRRALVAAERVEAPAGISDPAEPSAPVEAVQEDPVCV